MANAIRYSTTGDTQSLKKGNFFFGVGDVGKGPSSATTYYNGSTPVASGYTIYSYDVTQTSRISYASPTTDSEFIRITNAKSGQNFTGVTQCLNWYSTQTDYVAVNKDYEPIISNGLVLNLDASYTPSYTTSGTTWYDLAYSGYNGTLTNGPTYSSFSGGSIVFDGTNDYVQTTYNTQLNDFSINAWFRNTSSTGYARIVDKSYANGFWFGQNGISNNQWGGGVRQTDNYNFITLPNNQWHFLTMTRSGSSLKVYGNGIGNTNTSTCGTGLIDTTILSLGGTVNDGGGARDWFTGNISNIQLYNRELTPTEILQNYQATFPRFLGENIVTNGLVLYLDAGYRASYPTTGTTWNNVSGVSGGTGTLTNGPTYSSTNGGSILFDGIDDYVVTPSFRLSSATSCLTFNFWVKPSGQTSVIQTILGKDTNIGNVPHILIGRSVNSDALRWNYNNGTSSGILSFLNFFTGYDNTWINIQIVADYSLDIVTLYRNGTQFGQQSQPSSVFPSTDTIMYLSSFAINAFLVFKGNISISQIYNRDLTATEVLQNFNAQKSRFGL